jgi:hypothetical protein
MTVALPNTHPLKRKPTLLRASGAFIDTRDRESLRLLVGTKQVWQTDSWVYRDLIPELRFAGKFIANAIGRVKVIGAATSTDSDDPVPFAKKPDGVSDELMQAVEDELARLPLDSGADFQGKIAENFDLTGECWLHGYTDPLGRERWEVLSVDEVRIAADGGMFLVNGKGQIRHQVDPSTEDMLRLWLPHPRYSDFADAPMRAMQDLCGEIVLNGRERRAVRRSRAAANGILLLPDGLSLQPATQADQEQDPDEDGFMAEFTAAMLAPINNEGEPGAVVPMVIKGNTEDLAGVRHLQLVRDDNTSLLAALDNALQRLGTGLDLPPEVLSGIGETNHWTGAQIDLNTYRYHIDPRVRNIVDSLTEGYLWPRLIARKQFDLQEIALVRVWFDAGNLTENPNRAQDAKDAHDRVVINDDALRDALGFSEEDAPDDKQVLRQLLMKTGMDPITAAQLIQRVFAPGQDVLTPARTTVTIEEHEGPKGLEPVTPQTGQGTPTSGNTAGEAPPSNTPAPPPGLSDLGRREWALAVIGMTRDDIPAVGTDTLSSIADALTAAGGYHTTEADSARLVEIERALRDRLIVAAEDAIERALEKAGARVRSSVQRTPELRERLKDADAASFAMLIGEAELAKRGVDLAALLTGAFEALHAKWLTWTSNSILQLSRAVAKLLGLKGDEARKVSDHVNEALAARQERGWSRLESRLREVAQQRLYHPSGESRGESKAALVPPGVVRAALAEVGGVLPGSGGATEKGGSAANDGVPAGGLVGETVMSTVADQGGQQLGYEWVYGITPTPREFEPHEKLDGARFGGWMDEQLNTRLSPGYEWVGPFFHPGDHDGCMCDYVPVWAIPEYRDTREALQVDSGQISGDRILAATDEAARRSGTVAQGNVAERDRIVALQQRFLDRNPA